MSAKELAWGPIILTHKPQAATEHFVVMGATGSGKSLLIKNLMAGALSSLPGEGQTAGQRNRAVVYDPKQEMVSTLGRLGLSEETGLRILHPFDTRAYCWDMARDISSPIEARQVATLLVPDTAGTSGGSENFFTDACRDLLAGVMLTFSMCAPNPASWTFRDVILCMLYQPYLRFILARNRTRDGRQFILNTRLSESYLGGADPMKADWRTISNIRSTLNATLAVYEPIAAAWQRAYDGDLSQGRPPRRFSISQWISSNDTVVLGNDEAARAPIDAINQALFKRMTEMVLSGAELTEAQKAIGEGLTWFFLDEAREAGKLDGLSSLMTKGRTKGACVVLGFQDIDGMRAVYGEQVANEIVGQCSHVAILRLSSPTTAEWAASMFGSKLADLTGTSIGKEGLQMSRNQQEAKNVYSEDLLFLPTTSPKNGLTGFFKSSRVRRESMVGFKQTLSWDKVCGGELGARPAGADLPNFLPGDMSSQFLEPWNTSDWARLGFEGDPPPIDSVPASSLSAEDVLKKFGI